MFSVPSSTRKLLGNNLLLKGLKEEDITIIVKHVLYFTCLPYFILFLRHEALYHIRFLNMFKMRRILFLKVCISPNIKLTKTSKLSLVSLFNLAYSLLVTKNVLFLFAPKFPHTVFLL